MAEQVLALYGKGKGPRVPLYGKNAAARVLGNLGESSVICHVESDDGVTAVECTTPGDHPLPEGNYVTLEYAGPTENLLCYVRM